EVTGAAPSICINEVDADQTSTDTEEFVELYDGGAGNTSLDGLVLVLFNGSNDLSYYAFDLDGQTTDANGYFTIGNLDVANVNHNTIGSGINSSDWLQNGADAVAIYQADDTDFPNGTAVTSTNLVD